VQAERLAEIAATLEQVNNELTADATISILP